jgi:nucleotide-binding universal stress UspA family protein
VRKPIQRIMVYIDGSEPSITGARYAICLASSCGAELVVCYVVNTTAVEELLRARIFLQDEQVEYEHDMEANAERYLNYVGDLAARKGVAVIREKGRGSVHREIVEAVKRHGVDLLVVGELSHIRSRRDECYDEVERAMRGAPCSVLIAKDEDRIYELYESSG